MKIFKTIINGCYEICPDEFLDERGSFVKTFDSEVFDSFGLNCNWKEEYYSVSETRVLRGLHFQLPPHDHEKLVYCNEGSVLDAVLDLRKDSPTYGQHQLFNLDGNKITMLYLPKGVAHGFYVTKGPATIFYKVSTVYAPSHDSGIRWDLAAIPWPDADPIISQRDSSFQGLLDFVSPFSCQEKMV